MPGSEYGDRRGRSYKSVFKGNVVSMARARVRQFSFAAGVIDCPYSSQAMP
ncbi:MAG: hypothetical protein ACRBCJ_04625 [Hyphomicrobiaceae bacterium]